MRSDDVAFVTMVRDDDFFLEKWITYYSQWVEQRNLFVIFDGEDQVIPKIAKNCSVMHLPRVPSYAGWDADRWHFLSHFASALSARYSAVVVNDVDELLVAEPELSDNFIEVIKSHAGQVVSPFALELVHRTDLEDEEFDFKRGILDQRRHVRINASYCKPCVTRIPISWSIGGHYSDHPTINLSDKLFLFHLRYFDRNFLVQRQNDRHAWVNETQGIKSGDVAGGGWSKSGKEIGEFLDSFVDRGPPELADFKFSWQRKRIENSWALEEGQSKFKHAKLHNRRTYILPEKFRNLF